MLVVSRSHPGLASARRGSLAFPPSSPCTLLFRSRVRLAGFAGRLRAPARLCLVCVQHRSMHVCAALSFFHVCLVIAASHNVCCVTLAPSPRVRSAGFAGFSSCIPVCLDLPTSRPLGGVRWFSSFVCAFVLFVSAVRILHVCVPHSRLASAWRGSLASSLHLSLPCFLTSRPLGGVRWSPL